MKIQRLLPVTILTILLLVFLFRGILFNLNSTFFSGTGDGLKSYYCAWYHIEHDSTASHFEGMNYPWGESMQFTDGQPPLADAIRYINQHLFTCADKTVGVFNFMMVLSILLSAIFIFLILMKFKLPVWYATLFAIGITFLSPQIGRLPGHFSLAWVFWIPLMILLIIEIIEKPLWWKSIVFGLVVLLASLMHMYFFLFAVALIGIHFIYKVFIRFDKKTIWIEMLHSCIQIVIPFIILQLIMVDNQLDRTNHPYGFLAYRAYPGSVFLPVHKWYAHFISTFHFVRKYEWESLSYIGIIASVGFWILFIGWFKRIIKKKTSDLSFTDNHVLDILFWSSFLLLLFSFGLPFILGLEKLRNSIGFLSQLRGVGRFAWLFYYVINIIVAIKLYQFYMARQNKKTLIFMLILIGILGFEAFDYSRGNVSYLKNEVLQLQDKSNQMVEDRWVDEISSEDYQAILPLPYFHIGSESTWIEAKCDIARHMYIASIKTGLPCTGVMMGRTSLSQTYKNIEFCLTPWDKYRVIDEYPNQKPLLVMVAKCDELNRDEKRLIEKSTFITSSVHFDMYSLSLDSIKAIPAMYNFPAKYSSLRDSIGNRMLSGFTDCYIHRNNIVSTNEPEQDGVTVTSDFQRIMEAPVSIDSLQTLYLRFWVKNIDKDMVARTQLLIIQADKDHKTLNEKYSDIFRHLRSINDKWSLIEIQLEPKQRDLIIKLLIKNKVLEGEKLYFDEFSISQNPLF